MQMDTVWHWRDLELPWNENILDCLQNVFLLKHDNSGPHSAKMTQQLLQRFWWEIL